VAQHRLRLELGAAVRRSTYRLDRRDCGRAVTSSLHVDEVLATLARMAADALGSPECVIFDYDAAADTLTDRALYEEDPQGYEDLGVPIPLGDSPSDRVLLENRRIVVETLSDPDIAADSRASMERWGRRPASTCPSGSVTRRSASSCSSRRGASASSRARRPS
jgi:hypothetical protein